MREKFIRNCSEKILISVVQLTTMTEPVSDKNNFINQATLIIRENITNDQFGVSELADAMGMSRSNLLRKIKKQTHLSASLFIREVRLESATELLKQENYTVSEIAYKVGFSSPSYFIKCFRERYGFPPGDYGKEQIEVKEIKEERSKKIPVLPVSIAVVALLAVVIFFVLRPDGSQKQKVKSIAVLPFINDSSDSSNVYIINGLMESTLNNLQQIKDIRVISRTSVEKYRNNPKTTPEIAKELNATYIIEGSGQKIENRILLTIQLIEAATDNHLWSQQYQRDTDDIFNLQADVAKNIAEQIEAIITPEEAERIEKIPTDNLVAYDYFLQGLDLLNNPVSDNIEHSISWFHKAIAHDNKFARSYAAIAIAYYFMDEKKIEKQYSDSINFYADRALFYDSKLPQSLIAKALFYMAHGEYELAIPYFEKVLEISPNNDLVLVFLVDLYVHHLPDSQKYLEYALRGLQVDLVAAYDSATASFSYLHISNAFIQSGFVDEAEKYINKSLELMPENLYSEYVKAFILYARNENLIQLKSSLHTAYQKDSSRLDVMQEVAKLHYYLGDYEKSYFYYKKFTGMREAYKLDIYNFENYKISFVFEKMGDKQKATELMESFKSIAENTQSIYKHYNLALYYSYIGETDKAIEHLGLFAEEENYSYWIVLFSPIEPLILKLKDHPEYKRIFNRIEKNFEQYHKKVERTLKEKKLI